MLQRAFLLSDSLMYPMYLELLEFLIPRVSEEIPQVLWTVGVRGASVPELAALYRASTSTQLMPGMS